MKCSPFSVSEVIYLLQYCFYSIYTFTKWWLLWRARGYPLHYILNALHFVAGSYTRKSLALSWEVKCLFATNPWQCISSALHLLRDKGFLLWAVGKAQRQTKTQPRSAALNQKPWHFLSQNCPAQMQAASDTFSMESYLGIICVLEQAPNAALLTRAWRGIAVLCVENNTPYLFVENTTWW